MRIKERIRDLAYKIDSDDKTTHLLTLCQVIGTVVLAFYSVDKIPSKLKPASLWIFIILQSTVVIVLMFRSAFAGKYTTIKLIYNKATGVLFDRKIHARNISFRADTINAILMSVPSEKVLFETGKKIGRDFHNCFQDNLQQTGKGNIKITEKIKKWFEYDSSSGMGKFHYHAFEQQPFRLVLTITNPFTGTCQDNNICKFLKGYIVGFCESLFNQRYIAIECEWLVDRTACKLTITESNKVLTV